MRRKRKLVVAGLCMTAILATAGITAYFTDTVSVKNNFETGIVKIEIDEYEKTEDGGEKPYEDPKTEVVPGDEISKIARITNKEVDAWIRAKVVFDFENPELSDSLTLDDLEGIDPEKWVLAGDGYFYYKEILKTGESVDLFTGVTIPPEWNNAYANCKFTVDVQADGIQAKNFTPDFNTDSPWGDVEIETCAYPEEIDPSQEEDSSIPSSSDSSIEEDPSVPSSADSSQDDTTTEASPSDSSSSEDDTDDSDPSSSSGESNPSLEEELPSE